MDGESRRSLIWETLTRGGQPVTAGSFARRFGVSRQVIVQDVALLRAGGAEILATPSGYLVPGNRPAGVRRVFLCRHTGRAALRRELEIIAAHGGRAVDVTVDHPVYGEFRAMLMIGDEAGIRQLETRLDGSGSAPLSTLTGGLHLHTVEAPTRDALDAIEAALGQAGFLAAQEDET